MIGKNKDKQAFISLFECCSGRLKAFAIKCGATSDDADELLQECMLTVWRKAATFNPRTGTAMTWLYTIIRNKRIDLARKGHYNLVASEDLWQEESGETLENEVSSDLNARSIRSLINNLPDEQRQIVFKVYFEGKSHSEIAEDISIPLGTVKSRLRLAMKKLDELTKEQATWLIIILMMNF